MLETFASHLDSLAALAPVWKILLVFVFMAIESSFIPFPSEVVMIPAGFMAARGEMGCGTPIAAAIVVLLVGIVGSLAGAYVNYFLALKAGKPFLLKYGKWFFLKPAALERSCEVFNKYGAATTFVCRMVPAIRQLISIPAGISRMPLGSFSLFTALGAGIWTAILTVVTMLPMLPTAYMCAEHFICAGSEQGNLAATKWCTVFALSYFLLTGVYGLVSIYCPGELTNVFSIVVTLSIVALTASVVRGAQKWKC